MTLLKIEDLCISFSGLRALNRVSLRVQDGEVLGLIGPNGAGKTTLLNCISRLYEPSSGQIQFAGEDLLRVPIHRIAEVGIARTFQNLEVHRSATVLENVTMGGAWRHRVSLLSELLRLPSARRGQMQAESDARRALDLFGLGEYANQPIGSLSFGTQKTIELARAMASQPRLLLLDEPAAGLNPEESVALADTIRDLRNRGDLTIVLIEHDMPLVMKACDRIAVLDHGEKISEGTPEQVRGDPVVMAAYLGTGDDDA